MLMLINLVIPTHTTKNNNFGTSTNGEKKNQIKHKANQNKHSNIQQKNKS
jgi:hypothetical protein